MAALAMLLLATTAGAQSAADQYIPSPNPDGTQSSGGPAPGAGTPPASGVAAGPRAAKPKSGSSSGTDVPFTGYPLTPAVDLVLLLIVGGLVLRFIVPRLDRRHA